ncbi:hypothetical protein FRC19_001071 [Serendipita sp. 401]|nr:hypothetical protein FRC19_001071 [Serendipita sp. 401]KAG9054917.1 hypothetical protein FS842_003758 [Serendipita sp. 407]
MDVRLVTSPSHRNAGVTPMTASFSKQTQAALLSPKASSAPVRPTTGSFFGVPRSDGVVIAETDEDLSRLDPDELFVRFTVAQVKALATRLRTEAEAKQEELRLMVGERYRDLLEASSSIIDMSSSSQGVLDSIREMKETCAGHPNRRLHAETRPSTEADSQLKGLQSLAAHLKLLLDCPEHFWKLLEARKYLDAAWLFLIAIVVHQALVEEDEEDGWAQQGIDVLERFPLIQRQWDIINSFKAQISHKATQSLREVQTVQDTMKAIISLVLLDSRSLSDTLGELLAQRTKSIQAFFSSSNKNEIQENGEAENPENKRTRSQRVRDAKRIFRQAIDLLAETVHTVRSIYSTSSNSSHSTIQSLLVEIQSDADESLISTRKVLNALPSASLLDLYLPPSIKSYTHFIDTTGPSFQISPAFVSSKLETWFKKGLDAFNSRSKYWIDMLDSATDVEKVRISVLTSPSLQHLSTQEKEILTRYIGETCNNRITAIWKDAFVALHVSFEEALTKAVGIIAQSGHETQLDLNPLTALLSSRLPWPPSVRGNQSQSSIDTAFSKFDTALRIRRTNRTPLLESILVIVETRLKEFHSELDAIASTKDATKHTFLTQLLPLEDQILQRLISSMEKAAKTDQESSQISKIGPVIFVGRVAAELGKSLALESNTTTRGESVAKFRQSAKELHLRTLSIWETATIGRILSHISSPGSDPHTDDTEGNSSAVCIRPSPILLEALTSLTAASQQLGLSRSDLHQGRILQTALRALITGYIPLMKRQDLYPLKLTSQRLWDLFLLRQLSQGLDIQSSIDKNINELKEQLNQLMTLKESQKLVAETQKSVEHGILRLQMILLPLFLHLEIPDETPSTSTLLLRGIPPAETISRPTIELAQPCSRFGLLLVAGSTRTTNR